ncbi:hypothetical protein EJD97_003996 [Solanum chilense]|uniref:Uncharacterized protein n=1 Tax=Solanum chilense TaxID=4083 RepID=A0A6N2BSH1_SOLCI|nr:hypothetical protein EJD97_003996 [Solanum chilense]
MTKQSGIVLFSLPSLACLKYSSILFPQYKLGSIMIYQQHSQMENNQEREIEYSRASKMNAYIHSQIMRIRAEDSQLGEDIAKKLRERVVDQDVASVFMLSRPMLPASPLGGKTPIKSAN